MLFPPSFEERIKRQLGDEYTAFAQVHQKPSSFVSVRVNPCKKQKIEKSDPVLWSENSFYLSQGTEFVTDPFWHSGGYYVQDASSMFVGQAFTQLFKDNNELNVLDLCAAPGGKSTHLLSLLNKKSLLVANEVVRSRVKVLEENIRKWGRDNVVITSNDPGSFEKIPGFFDLIVVDAPCSGEGLFRKYPLSKQEWSNDSARHCSERQKRILMDVWPALKEGGILLYSTCTYNPEENEDNLKWLAGHADIENVRLDIEPGWNIRMEDHEGITGYHFYPHLLRGEGFFISCVRKISSSVTKTKFNRKRGVFKVNNDSQALDAVAFPDEMMFVDDGQKIVAFESSLEEKIVQLKNELNVVSYGIPLFEKKGLSCIPLPELALYTGLNKRNYHNIDLDYTDSLNYLSRKEVKMNVANEGWLLINYDDQPLGWVKKSGHRVNNYFPMEWRIRKIL